jgi:hypothetical protein
LYGATAAAPYLRPRVTVRSVDVGADLAAEEVAHSGVDGVDAIVRVEVHVGLARAHRRQHVLPR